LVRRASDQEGCSRLPKARRPKALRKAASKSHCRSSFSLSSSSALCSSATRLLGHKPVQGTSYNCVTIVTFVRPPCRTQLVSCLPQRAASCRPEERRVPAGRLFRRARCPALRQAGCPPLQPSSVAVSRCALSPSRDGTVRRNVRGWGRRSPRRGVPTRAWFESSVGRFPRGANLFPLNRARRSAKMEGVSPTVFRHGMGSTFTGRNLM
jgi:hypothetical protein